MTVATSEGSSSSSRWITALLALVFFLPVAGHLRSHFGVLPDVPALAFFGGAAVLISVMLFCYQSDREAKHHRD